MKSILVVDSFGLFFRSFYAAQGLKTKDGKPSSMVFGLCQFLLKLEEYKSDYIIFALEGGNNFRKQIDPNYKANRSEAPEELKEQLPICIKMLEKSGLKCISVETYEADDIIASISKKLKGKYHIQIFSSDKDLYQLIDQNCVLIDPKTSNVINEQGCIEKFGLKPNQIKDFLAICGDSADNIKGIKGIGAKGAKDLLSEYKDIEGIYNNINLISNKKQQAALASGKDDLELSLKLVSLCGDTLDNLSDDDILKGADFPSKNPLFNLEDYIQEYALNSIYTKLQNQNKAKKEANYLLLDEKSLDLKLDELKNEQVVGFDCETTGLEKDSKMVGFSFCVDENEAFYVPIAHKNYDKNISYELAKKAISKIFECYVVGHNLKYDFEVCKREFLIDYPKKYKDTMILAWLNDSSGRVGLDFLAEKIFGFAPLYFEQIVAKGATFADVDIKTATKYAAKDAFITFMLYFYYLKNLDKELLEASEFECDFIPVLINMEKNGIKVDINKLEDFTYKLKKELALIEDDIYKIAGTMFNVGSPKQLAEILFTRLELKSPTKKQSTDASVLAKIEHPIIEHILKYREISKLISTYCEPFIKYASLNDENRIFTNFLQTRTATGRLASNEPNLQNLPSRGDYAKEYKSCFIANDGYVLLSLDYSQIELRLLAHFSKEPTLVKAFLNNEDIHTQTAINIFGSSDSDKRRVAKSINFGLIYGMGYKKLSEELKIPQAQAKEYIQKYFEHFSGLYNFFENVKKNAKENGYVKTLLKRKRFFDYANATPMLLAGYDRESVNSILQGSAADIIKTAMIQILPLLDDDKKMLLQIHDELIFEVKEELAQEFAKQVQNIMENVFKLEIPLKTSLSIAKSWGDLK